MIVHAKRLEGVCGNMCEGIGNVDKIVKDSDI